MKLTNKIQVREKKNALKKNRGNRTFFNFSISVKRIKMSRSKIKFKKK